MTHPGTGPPDGPFVLIVEDDALTQQVIAQTLREEGCAVAVVASGQEALDVARDRLPSVIVLDHRLEDMSGREFMRRYRLTPTPHAPVVLVTAEYDPQGVADEIGVDALVSKPFELDDLLDTLRPYVECLS